VSRRGIRPGARTCGRDLASPLPAVWDIFSPNRPGHSVRTTQRPMTKRSSLRDARAGVNSQPRLICRTPRTNPPAARQQPAAAKNSQSLAPRPRPTAGDTAPPGRQTVALRAGFGHNLRITCRCGRGRASQS